MKALVLHEEADMFTKISSVLNKLDIEVIPVKFTKKVVQGSIQCNILIVDWDTLVKRNSSLHILDFLDNHTSLQKSILISSDQEPSAEILTKVTHRLGDSFTSEELESLLKN